MLEVKHLKRTYKIKNADPVHALNDVSIRFPEKGLVFILGKSGSGKSTLLNVIGGLDVADEGEIIIDGKSSKEFTKGELDSYRNTYLGFIFQEYNILPDFTVRENIALALQLQHKKATDEIIDGILEEVDLKGYGKRKPNELSGGQKQRVAIARALVKEPKIIFADEPTGALDSNTGKQVFETLKKLSKDKLVVVVSHDRDFAEHFGDRVIELKDGVIISDVEKKPIENVTPTEGLDILGENVIRISKDHPLTSEDLPYINKAISQAQKDVYIVADEKVNEAVRQAAKINESGERTKFDKTNEDDIKSSNEEFKIIKSKFSLGQAFRMGAKSLRVKPFRLIMTIFLSTVSFSLFGASFTLSLFSRETAVMSTIERNNISSSMIYIGGKGMEAGLTEERIDKIKESGLTPYLIQKDWGSLKCLEPKSSDSFHMTRSHGTLATTDQFLDDFQFEMFYGEMPKNAYECAISKYAYYSYKDLGYYDENGDYVMPEDVKPENVIGQMIYVENQEMSLINGYSYIDNYKITGIIDTKFPEKYEKYREDPSSLTFTDENYSAIGSIRSGQSIHSQLFVRADVNQQDNGKLVTTNFGEKGFYRVAYIPSVKHTYYFDKNKISLADGEAIISMPELESYFEKEENKVAGEEFLTKVNEIHTAYNAKATEYIAENYEAIYEKYHTNSIFKDNDEVKNDSEKKKEACLAFLFASNVGWKTDEYAEFYETFVGDMIDILNTLTKIPEATFSDYLAIGSNKEKPNELVSLKIVGLDLDSIVTFTYKMKISKTYAETLINALKANDQYNISQMTVTSAYISFASSKNTESFLKYYFALEDAYNNAQDADELTLNDYRLTINDTKIANVENIAVLVLVLTHVFVWIGVILAVFSMLLFYNFISVSINNKKREIGILRAVGAKRSDVFKIFYSEAFIIAVINFILSLICVFVVSHFVNGAVSKNELFDFNLMSPNFLVVLALFGISLGASVIAALLPVLKIANKKPIDAIQNR